MPLFRYWRYTSEHFRKPRPSNKIKTLCWILILASLFLFAVVHFSSQAHGSQGYINDLDLSTTTTPVSTQSLAYVQAVFVPRHAVVVQDESNPYIEYLRSIAGSFFDLEARIVKAESGWHPQARNKLSTASGLAQYLDSTFLSQCVKVYGLAPDLSFKNDPYVQLNCLNAMIQDGKQSHWSASQKNWE